MKLFLISLFTRLVITVLSRLFRVDFLDVDNPDLDISRDDSTDDLWP